MSEKLSERAARIGGFWLVEFAPEIAALEQQLAEKDAEIARLRDIHNERIAQLTAHRVCCGTEHDPLNGKLHGFCVVCGVPWPCEYAGMPIALAETPAAPTTLCGQAERDKRLIELTTDNSFIYYGPHPCPACGYTICKVANEQGGEAFDYPVGPIYPNTNWTIHNCQRSAFKGPHDSEGNCILCAHKAHLGKCRETDCGCEIHELGGDSCRGCDPAAPLTTLALPEDDVPDAVPEYDLMDSRSAGGEVMDSRLAAIGDELNQCLQIILTNAGLLSDMTNESEEAATIESAVARAAKAVHFLAHIESLESQQPNTRGKGMEHFPVPEEEPRRLNTHDVFLSVYEDIKRRNELGWAQHAKPLLVDDHSLLGWLEEAYAETLDKAVYLKGAILKLKGDSNV